jgi:hypothetical protein
MKHNINIIRSVWRQWRKPSRATLDAICSQNAMYEAGTETKRRAQLLDSAARQHIARLAAERHELLTMAKAVVRLRDMNESLVRLQKAGNHLIDTVSEVEVTTTSRKA